MSGREKGKAKASLRERREIDSEETRKHAEKILGKSLRNFSLRQIFFTRIKQVKVKPSKKDGMESEQRETVRQIKVVGTQLLFIGSTASGNTFSEFNFGAGEASVLRMVAEIEQLPESSLVLIEEVENGLHPLAVTRLVEYLIEVADRKRLQVIYTTHSEYALMPLPSEGIWAAVNGELIRGHLSIESLRAITGRFDKQLAIFCEDDFARAWLEAIFRIAFHGKLPLFGFYHLNGDGTAVKVHKTHNFDPAVNTKSVCFIDGDSRQTDDESNLIYRLPGESPERHLFDGVRGALDSKLAVLTAGVQLPLSEQSRVKEVIEKIGLTNRDPHLLFSQIGEQLGLISEEIVRGAFFAIWINQNSEYVERVKSIISPMLELQIAQGRKK